jgi:hypothetical protein
MISLQGIILILSLFSQSQSQAWFHAKVPLLLAFHPKGIKFFTNFSYLYFSLPTKQIS